MKLRERVRDKQAEQELSPPRPGSLGRWIAWIVLLVSLGSTFFIWDIINDLTINRARERFTFQTETIDSALRERLRSADFLLQSGAAFFAASEEVTREEWHAFVAELDFAKYYSGVQGFGFSMRILPSEKEAHIERIREEGFPDYDIKPRGERSEYTSIVFLEPFDWRNQQAFGYDMYSEPTRAAAMDKARDSGLTTMSGKVTLVQETANGLQEGFLVYLPVYRKGETPATLEERRATLVGYVYSPFRVADFMYQVLAENGRYIELQIFDGDEPREEALLYTYGNTASLLSESERLPFATYQSILEYAGHDWLLVYKSSPLFEEIADTVSSRLILVLGIIISLLLFMVLWFFAKSHRQSLAIARRNKELESALSNIDQLTGMLPICASCKKIKDDAGYWQVVESYISTHTKAVFSHGLCPECAAKAHEELEMMKQKKSTQQASPIRPVES